MDIFGLNFYLRKKTLLLLLLLHFNFSFFLVHICANEPSLAFFRLSEHVRKALPPTVESRQQVQTIQRQLGVAYEDADVALQ